MTEIAWPSRIHIAANAAPVRWANLCRRGGCLKTESGAIVTTEDEPGEIQVRGPVCSAPIESPLESAESFEAAGFAPATWRCASATTTASWRLSVDIIKSGG